MVSSIAGIELRSDKPDEYATRWSSILGTSAVDGVLTLAGDSNTIRFADGRTSEQAGLDVVDFTATERSRVGTSCDVGGTLFRFV